MERAIVISDTHVGSWWGLLPTRMFNADTNPFQKWVMNCWGDMIKMVGVSVDHIFLVGDLTDGAAMKSAGVDVTSTDLDNQVAWTCELLKPIVGKNTKVYGVDGSGYHSGKETNTDRRIVEYFNGKYEKATLHLKIGNKIIQLNHASGAMRLQLEMDKNKKYAQETHTVLPDLLLRGHVHQYKRVEDASMGAISCPCWQYPTPFIERRSTATKWDIGFLAMEFDKDILKIYPKLYPIPLDVIEQMRGYTNIITKSCGASGNRGTPSGWLKLNRERRW